MSAQIVLSLMTKEEALAATSRIKEAVSTLRHELTEVYEREGWKVLGYSSMNEYMRTEFPDMSKGKLYQELQAGRTERNLTDKRVTMVTPPTERALRPIAKNKYIDRPDVQREIYQDAVDRSPNGKPKAKDTQAAVDRYEQNIKQTQPKGRNYLTLTEWNDGHREVVASSRAQMNKTNDNIEWARWSWNPVTGCLHNCDYCYARDIANRFYPQEFQPSFIPERLTMPDNTKPTKEFGGDKVFTCSMADLFGKWVPEDWINSVLETINRNPQWTFLLLSKFPIRMAEFEYPPNVWLGTTVDRQFAVDRAEKAFTKIKAAGFDGVCWLSCEPMLERLTFSSLNMFDWVVIGGASKSSQTPEHKPPFDDIVHLYNQARRSSCQVYMKTNLLGSRIREYPQELT